MGVRCQPLPAPELAPTQTPHGPTNCTLCDPAHTHRTLCNRQALATPPPHPQPEEVRSLVKVGQEAFLTQLLDIGFFHGGQSGARRPLRVLAILTRRECRRQL